MPFGYCARCKRSLQEAVLRERLGDNDALPAVVLAIMVDCQIEEGHCDFVNGLVRWSEYPDRHTWKRLCHQPEGSRSPNRQSFLSPNSY
jgi:hypothetical protein